MFYIRALILFFSLFGVGFTEENDRIWLNQRYLKAVGEAMDATANPCEDFYQYACGSWEQNHQDIANKYSEMLSMTDYEVNEELACCFDKMSLSSLPSFVAKAFEYYRSCMQMQELDHHHYKDWMLQHENLRWPKLSSPLPQNSQCDWVYMLGVMRRYGLNGIFVDEMMIHRPDDRSKTIVDLDKPIDGGGFASLTYENLSDLLKYLNIQHSSKTFEKLWHTISNFERRLADLNAMVDEESSRLITVSELPFPWMTKYLAIVLNKATLDANMELYIHNMPYMEALYDLLKKYDNQFICRYLEVRFLWHLQQQGPRSFTRNECVSSTRRLMPLAMHWFYEQQHLPLLEYTPVVLKLFDNIVDQFNASLQSNEMKFNQTVLVHLMVKLENIQLKVGNLPRLHTIKVLEDFYKDLVVDSADFYGNHMRLLNFFFKASHANIAHTLTSNMRHFFNLEVYGEGGRSSPYFLSRSNVIMLPLSSLRMPLFHPHFENVFLYSSLGSTLAHEIFHGFDRIGLTVDYRGDMNYWQYRNILATPAFRRKYNCLRELYPEIVNEKIADLSGLRLAYESFFSMHPQAASETRRVLDEEIPLRKLFFLSYAQLFCDPNLSDAEHGNVSDRINDAMRHYREFSRVFGCSRQNRMLREDSCLLWQ